MPVLLGDNATAPVGVSATTSASLNTLTISSHPNLVLVVQLGFQIQSVSGISVVWDSGGANQSCSLIGSQATPGTSAQGIAYLFGLVAPVTGNKTLAVSWTTSSAAEVNAASFYNVDQTGGVTTFKNFTANSGTSTTPNVTVPCGSNDIAVDVACAPNQVPFPVGQTSLFTASSTSPNTSGSYATGPNVPFSYGPMSGSDVWADIGVALNFTFGVTAGTPFDPSPSIRQAFRVINY